MTLAPLTVLCGENNTGKTYITYATYALFSSWRYFFPIEIPGSVVNELSSKGVARVDLKDLVSSKWSDLKLAASENWKSNLPNALAAPEGRFARAQLEFDVELDDRWVSLGFERDTRSANGNAVFKAHKKPGDTILEIVALKSSERDSYPYYMLDGFVEEVVLEAVLRPYFSSVFMASAERTGAVVFKDELNLTKNKIVTLLSRMERNKSQQVQPNEIFDAIYTTAYPSPVNQNVQFVNAISFDGEPSSRLLKENPHLLSMLKAMVGGDFQTNKEGLTQFVPRGTKEKLGLTEASSAVRSLMILWNWLTEIAAPGDLLMIDEPEMNLHPKNQRRMARWIAALINAGVRVFLTTHSDYIIREINLLILMKAKWSTAERVARKSGYEENELLDLEDVRLFVCKQASVAKSGNKRKSMGGTIVEADRSPLLGLEVSTFDGEINDMNSLFDEIYYSEENSRVES